MRCVVIFKFKSAETSYFEKIPVNTYMATFKILNVYI